MRHPPPPPPPLSFAPFLPSSTPSLTHLFGASSVASLVRGETLEIFTVLCLAASLVGILRAVLFFATTLRASTSLHSRAIASVMAAPMW